MKTIIKIAILAVWWILLIGTFPKEPRANRTYGLIFPTVEYHNMCDSTRMYTCRTKVTVKNTSILTIKSDNPFDAWIKIIVLPSLIIQVILMMLVSYEEDFFLVATFWVLTQIAIVYMM